MGISTEKKSYWAPRLWSITRWKKERGCLVDADNWSQDKREGRQSSNIGERSGRIDLQEKTSERFFGGGKNGLCISLPPSGVREERHHCPESVVLVGGSGRTKGLELVGSNAEGGDRSSLRLRSNLQYREQTLLARGTGEGEGPFGCASTMSGEKREPSRAPGINSNLCRLWGTVTAQCGGGGDEVGMVWAESCDRCREEGAIVPSWWGDMQKRKSIH